MTTVLLAVGSAADRDVVRDVLAEKPGLSLLGEAASAAHMRALILDRCPDVVVADLRLSEGSVLDAIAEVRAIGSPTRCLVLIAGPAPDTVHRAVLAGVDGVVSREDIAGLDGTIRAVHHGEQVFPAELLETPSSATAIRRPRERSAPSPTARLWSYVRRTSARGSDLVAAARPTPSVSTDR